MPTASLKDLLKWIDAEIQKSETAKDKLDGFPELSSNYARIRYFKQAKGVIMEYQKNILKIS